MRSILSFVNISMMAQNVYGIGVKLRNDKIQSCYIGDIAGANL